MSVVLEGHEPSAKYLLRNEHVLLRGFELCATAPQGIARLRALILELALQGKLVSQSAKDEPATTVLAKISAQKMPLTGNRAKSEVVSKVARSNSDNTGNLPANWAWSSLAEIGLINPRNNADDDAPASFVRMSSIPVAMMELHAKERRPWREIKSGFTHFADGDVGVAKITPCFENGKSTVFRNLDSGIGAGTTELHIVRPLGGISPEYVLVFLKSPAFLRNGEAGMTGSAGQKRLARTYFENTPFPLPPLAEQHRIVARVEELMKLCDALEARGRLADEQHARLTSTLFDALAASESAHALAESWQCIAEHFDLLLDRPDAVDALEQTIFRLAVRGLLLPQSEKDESAKYFLKRIRDEKERLVSQGTRKVEGPQPLVSDEEKPFVIPPCWEWVRFGELVHVSSGITLGRKSSPINPITLPYLRVANVQRWFLNLNQMKTIEVDESELPRFLLRSGDLLLTEGGDWDKVGRTCIWNGELERCLHQNHVFKARGVVADWSPVWAELFLNSIDARNFFAAASKQTTNLASINSTQLKSCPFPLPPVHEQQRIVARLEELRHLCTQLRGRLTSAQLTQSQLAESLVDAVANEPKPVTAKPASIAPHLVRAARNCYAINAMANEPGVGRTRVTKVDYLLANHIPAPYQTQHTRMPAGPHDEWISNFEKEGERNGWFTMSESITASGNKMMRYTTKPGILDMAAAGAKELGDKRVELDRVLKLLKGKKTEEVEMIATLYAVWNDALIAGQQCNDDALINDFFNWHEKKRRFDAKDLKSKLAWMRQNNLVPSGIGTSTSGQNKLFSD